MKKMLMKVFALITVLVFALSSFAALAEAAPEEAPAPVVVEAPAPQPEQPPPHTSTSVSIIFSPIFSSVHFFRLFSKKFFSCLLSS